MSDDKPFPRPQPREDKPFPRPQPRGGNGAPNPREERPFPKPAQRRESPGPAKAPGPATASRNPRDEKPFPRPQPPGGNGSPLARDERPFPTQGQSRKSPGSATASGPAAKPAGKGKGKSRMTSVKVFVRWRPLVGDELSRGDGTVARTCEDDGKGTSSISITSDRTRVKTWKGAGYSGVFDGPEGNAEVFETSVAPMLGTVLGGKCACLFCYGHTGSGKTHTVLGYGAELGLYRLGAAAIFETFRSLPDLPPGGLQLSVRFAELHCGRAYDLMDRRAECKVREDADGGVHFRKDPTVFPDGRVRVQPMAAVRCGSAQDVAAAVAAASSLRVVGSSSLHDQSSRSHAVLEMEVVSEELLAAREAVIHQESLLVPIGKVLEDFNFRQSQGEDVDAAEKEELQGRMYEQKEVLDAAQERLAEVMLGGPRCLGGSLVLVDLAGAEHGNDVDKSGRKQTPEEAREGKEINTSLLHLKEMVRAMASGSSHIPFRACRLTRVMRHWMRPGCCCSMVANASASDLHAAKSLNTLQYAALVASAGK